MNRYHTLTTYLHHTGKIAVIVELSVDTDFAAKTDEFKRFARQIAMQVAASDAHSPNELLKEPWVILFNTTVEDKIKELSEVLGEEVKIELFTKWDIR